MKFLWGYAQEGGLSCKIQWNISHILSLLLDHPRQPRACLRLQHLKLLYRCKMQNTNEGSLHENPFEVMEEYVTEAAPSFNVTEEDDVDDDFELDI